MSKRSEYWWYQNLYTPLEIKKINKSIKSSILEEKGSPAEHVVKTSDVKLFKLGNVPLLERFVLSALSANQQNFGYNLYPPQSELRLNYITYNKGNRYDWHMDSNFYHPVSDIKLTCLLNISEKTFEGGEFLLTTGLSKEIKEIIQPGSAIIFPSFFMHKVNPVIKGERTMVSLWLEGPKFQ